MNKIRPLASIFVDSSVILRLILGEKAFYADLEKADQVYISEILKVECYRNIDRLRLTEAQWNDQQTALRLNILQDILVKTEEIPLNKKILQRASESFPTAIKTLDAIHLASAIQLREHLKKPFLFITHDRQQSIAAMACGFETAGI